MTNLVLNITDLKNHAAIDFISGFDVLEPFISDAERWLKRRYLGAELFDKLAELHQQNADGSESVSESTSESASESSSDDENPILSKLLWLSQGIVTNMALLNYIPEGQLEISAQGIRINTTDTKKTAFEWQIKQLADRYIKGRDTKLEDLLQLLFENNVPEWASSPVMKKLRQRFINSALQFEKYCSIEESHLLFLRMLPDMDYAERIYMRSILGDAFLDELRERILDGEDQLGATPTDSEKAYAHLFDLIAAAVAYLTVQHTKVALPVEKPDDIERRAVHAQQQLKEYLDTKATASLFANYFNSDKYTAPAEDDDTKENGVDNSQFNSLYAAF